MVDRDEGVAVLRSMLGDKRERFTETHQARRFKRDDLTVAQRNRTDRARGFRVVGPRGIEADEHVRPRICHDRTALSVHLDNRTDRFGARQQAEPREILKTGGGDAQKLLSADHDGETFRATERDVETVAVEQKLGTARRVATE